MKISQGLAQVEFIQGATVVLEGPVEFEIINPNEGALAAGKLRAIVPKVATGFTVNVPKGRVIDLGTDFGLHVHDGLSTELFVYDGNVVYEGTLDSGDTITRELKTGDSIFVDPYGFPIGLRCPRSPLLVQQNFYRSMEEHKKDMELGWIYKSISNTLKLFFISPSMTIAHGQDFKKRIIIILFCSKWCNSWM